MPCSFLLSSAPPTARPPTAFSFALPFHSTKPHPKGRDDLKVAQNHAVPLRECDSAFVIDPGRTRAFNLRSQKPTPNSLYAASPRLCQPPPGPPSCAAPFLHTCALRIPSRRLQCLRLRPPSAHLRLFRFFPSIVSPLRAPLRLSLLSDSLSCHRRSHTRGLALEDDAQHGRAVEVVVVVLSWACGGEAKGKTEVGVAQTPELCSR